MSDTLVSIRMPKKLVNRLKELVHTNDYLDLSEQMRSIIRTQAIKYIDPHANSVNALRTQLENNIKEQNERLKKEEILRELKKLLEVDHE